MIRGMLAVKILLILAATYRATRLLVVDEIPLIRVPRDRLVAWLDPADVTRSPLGGFGRSIAYLVTCPWCTSMYVAAGVVWAVDLVGSVPLPPLLVLAASGVTGLVASAESGYEQRWKLRQRELDQPGSPR